jgi:hypothetical protein
LFAGLLRPKLDAMRLLAWPVMILSSIVLSPVYIVMLPWSPVTGGPMRVPVGGDHATKSWQPKRQ